MATQDTLQNDQVGPGYGQPVAPVPTFNIKVGGATPILPTVAPAITAGSTTIKSPSVNDLMANLYAPAPVKTAGVVAPVVTPAPGTAPVNPNLNPATGQPYVVTNADGSYTVTNDKGVTTTVPVGSPAPTAPTYTHSLSAQDLLDQGLENPATMAEPDPAAIYATQLKQVQDQIDQTNNVYNDMLAKSRADYAVTGKARLDSARLNEIANGQVGSGTAQGLTDNVTSANISESAAADAVINDKRATALAAINNIARTSAATELAYQRDQKSKNADAILNEINTRPQRKAAALSPVILDMLSKGVDPSKMTSQDLQTLATSFGKLNVAPEDIISEYKQQVSTQATAQATKDQATANLGKTKAETDKLNNEIAQGKWITIGDGSKIYNPTTKETIDNPKTFAPTDTEKAPTTAAVKIYINQQMATPEFKSMDDTQKADFILANGGTPSDFGY